jgi:hypothetical protein
MKQGFAGINDAIFRKRKSLNHEKEVRAVIEDNEHSDRVGLLRPVDLCTLISQVVISPFSNPWFEGVVKETLDRFGAPVEIATSEIALKPFF